MYTCGVASNEYIGVLYPSPSPSLPLPLPLPLPLSVPPSREKPLALYVFTEDNSLLQRVLHSTSAGGVVHNDVLQQYSGERSSKGHAMNHGAT